MVSLVTMAVSSLKQLIQALDEEYKKGDGWELERSIERGSERGAAWRWETKLA